MAWILIIVIVALTVIAVRILQKEESSKNHLLPKHCRKCGADIEPHNTICVNYGFIVHNGCSYCPNCGNDILEG